MVELWYAIVALMLTTYVVLDGYDFGAGALHLFVAKTDAERRQVLAAIGPYWDGNEVWLLASGGALLVGFPKALAAGLSGYYLAIFLLLWTLIVRGISIELRSHVEAPLWRAFWDAAFFGASALLAILFGAALGNILRGVSIGPDGWFSLPLFTDFSGRPPVGSSMRTPCSSRSSRSWRSPRMVRRSSSGRPMVRCTSALGTRRHGCSSRSPCCGPW
jgi:cytochrome d ubiquinol oxidase subunit II